MSPSSIQLNNIDDDDTFVRLVFAQEAMAHGDRRAARHAIASARDRTLERAARIGVPAWRESFLSRARKTPARWPSPRRLHG